jgi:hypothetical protein
MSKLLFVELVPEIAKAAGAAARFKLASIAVVGGLVVMLVGLAVILYINNQAEPGRLVIDVAIAFFSWATGRAVGEKAGVKKR